MPADRPVDQFAINSAPRNAPRRRDPVKRSGRLDRLSLSDDSSNGLVTPGVISLAPHATLRTDSGGAGLVLWTLTMITKIFRTYNMNSLRDEQSLRDHDRDVVTISRSCDSSGCRGIRHPGEDHQFAGHHRDGGADRGGVAGDEERKGVEDPPGEGSAVVDRPA
jgi:hypothetical protein